MTGPHAQRASEWVVEGKEETARPETQQKQAGEKVLVVSSSAFIFPPPDRSAGRVDVVISGFPPLLKEFDGADPRALATSVSDAQGVHADDLIQAPVSRLS